MRLSVVDYKQEVTEFMSYLSKGIPVVVFDLETTGLSSVTDRILSCSAIKLVYENQNLKEIDRMDVFINPGFQIPQEATDINGITNEMLKDAPRENKAIKEIMKFFGDKPLVAGYNSTKFDEKFMNAMYLRAWGDEFKPLFHLDVFQMAKEKVMSTSHSLEDIANKLGADIGLTFHRSMDDVIATTRIFKILYPHYLEDKVYKNSIKLNVLGVNYWSRGHKTDRLYIKTDPYEKVYYDIYKKEWICEKEHIDLKKLREDVLKTYGVQNEDKLVKLIKQNL